MPRSLKLTSRLAFGAALILALVLIALPALPALRRSHSEHNTETPGTSPGIAPPTEAQANANADTKSDSAATRPDETNSTTGTASRKPMPELPRSESEREPGPIDRLLENAEVLSHDKTVDDRGRLQEVWIVRADFKYPLLRITAPSNAAEGTTRQVMVADHLMVRKAAELDEGTFSARLGTQGYVIRKKMLARDAYLVAFGGEPSALINRFPKARRELSVLAELAEPDYLVQTAARPNDPLYGNLWGLRNGGNEVTVDTGSLAGTTFESGGNMQFAAAVPEGGLSGNVIDAGFGASAADFPPSVEGNIALIQRGSADGSPVTFATKVTNAINAGATAVLLFNNTEGDLNGSLQEVGDWPPVVVLSQADGTQLRDNLPTAVTLSETETGRDISAEAAWEIHTGSRDLLIGVIDTGIDYDHPDLAANIWTNPGESGFDDNGNDKATNGIDDDSNGLIDDVHGWDFANDDNDPMDDNRHGTHCAGTIGAIGDNGIGVTGVNWTAEMAAIKFLTGGGSGVLSDGVDSVVYATRIGCYLTNNSWGGGPFVQMLEDAIAEANAAGSLFIAAAGNSSTATPQFPASYEVPNVVSVAATTINDGLAGFSNFGLPHVDIGAPGRDIVSTVPTSSGIEYDSLSGTSMASPHVAGAAALLMSYVPGMTHLEVRQRLLETVDPIPSLEGRVLTGGRLNLAAAIEGLNPEAAIDALTLATSDAAPGGNGDGVANPGETVEITFTLSNSGYSPAPDVSASFTTTDGFTTVIDGASSFGTIDRRESANAADPIKLAFAPEAPSPHTVSGTLVVADTNGGNWSLPVTLIVSDTHLLSGTVQLDGTPLPNATVDYTGTTSGTIITDGSGAFSIAVPVGSFSLSTSLPGEPYSRTPGLATTTPGDQSGLLLGMTTATITGTVLDASADPESPVEGATVSLIGPATESLVSAADGSFTLTRVYGESATWQVTAAKTDRFDLPSTITTRTVPPDATGIELRLGFPEASFSLPGDAEGIEATAPATGEPDPVNRTLTLHNDGVTDLVWSAAGLVAPNGNPGELLDSFAPATSVANSQVFQSGGLAYHGGRLYHLEPGEDRLFEYDTSGNLLRSRLLAGAIVGFSPDWELSFHDGRHLWFQAPIPTPENPDFRFLILHALDPDSLEIVRSVEVDPSIRDSKGEQGLLWREARLSTIGDGFLWMAVGEPDFTTPNGRRTLSVARVNPLTGAVEATIPLPDEVNNPFSNTLALPFTFFNGSLWMIRSERKPGEVGAFPHDRIYEINPDDGTIVDSFAIPVGYRLPTGLTVEETGAFWLFTEELDSHPARFGKLDSGFRRWMTAEPPLGTLPAGQSVAITISLDPTLAGSGLHHGALNIAGNDPLRPNLFVPVLFNVADPDPANTSPTITTTTPSSPVSLDEDDSLTFTLNANDPDTDPLTYRWSLDGIETAVSTNAFTLSTGFADQGTHALAVSVDDGRGGVATHVWQIFVNNVNRAPVASNATYTLADADSVDLQLEASDPDGDPLTWEVLTEPASGTLDGLAPDFTYTPQLGTTGAFTLTFRVSDGEADSNTATVTFDVGTRDIDADLTPLTVTQTNGSTTTRTVTITNTGNRPLQWSAPMTVDASIFETGQILATLPEFVLPPTDTLDTGHTFSATFRGLAYDGGDLLASARELREDGIVERSHLVRYDLVTGQMIGDPIPAPADAVSQEFMTIEYLASTGSGIWFSNTRFVSDLSSRIHHLGLSEGTLYSIDRIFQLPADFGGANRGIAWSPFGAWIATAATSGSSGSSAFGIFNIEPDGAGRYQTLRELDINPDGPIAWGNGALWLVDDSSGDFHKLNPFTGVALADFSSQGSNLLALTYGEDGTFYAHGNDRSTVAQIHSGDFVLMSPDGGTLEAGESVVITLTFDSNLSGAGSQTGHIHLLSNDPDEPDLLIPFTHTVTTADGNQFPAVDSISPAPGPISLDARERAAFEVTTSDPDGDPVSINWILDSQTQTYHEGLERFEFVAPATDSTSTLQVRLDDGLGAVTIRSWEITTTAIPLGVAADATPTSGRVPLDTGFSSTVTGGLDTFGPFLFSDGPMVIEGENADRFIPFSDPATFSNFVWFPEGPNSGSPPYPGSVDGNLVNDTGFAKVSSFDKSGRVEFDLSFPAPGDYYLWMRVLSESATTNASFVSLNGSQIGGIFDGVEDSEIHNTWRWHRHDATFPVTATGEHVFGIHTHEPKHRIDRFVFTTDPAFDPVAYAGTPFGPLWQNPKGPDVTYSWDFGDSSPLADTANPNHTYTDEGTYNAELTATSGEETASDSVIITVTTTWADWLDLRLAGQTAANRLPEANPDKDPFSNLIEYALGLDPLTPDGNDALIGAIRDHEGSEHLALAYTHPTNREDLIYTVEVSGDLGPWAGNPDGTIVTEIIEVTNHGDGFRTITEIDLESTTSHRHRFIRLTIRLLP